jgi:nitrogen regulatory protein PII
MKGVFIIHGQGINAEVNDLLDTMGIRGFTKWEDILGRGSSTGEPRYGTHTWPALNNGILAVVEDNKVAALLEELKKLDKQMPQQGLRAFTWNIEDFI